MLIYILMNIALFFAGLITYRFATVIGSMFCRIGKKVWRICTFGLTDMAVFYPEEKAGRIFRLMGGGMMVAACISSILRPVLIFMHR